MKNKNEKLATPAEELAPEVSALLEDENDDSGGTGEIKFTSLTKELQDFINNSGFALKTKERLPQFFTLLDKDPDMSITDLCQKSGLKRSTYYLLVRNKAFSQQLTEFRANRIREDVRSSYGALVKLTKSKNEMVAFQAIKFMLENNGQEFGFGKKDDNTGVVRIEIEDKRSETPTYSDEDLADV